MLMNNEEASNIGTPLRRRHSSTHSSDKLSSVEWTPVSLLTLHSASLYLSSEEMHTARSSFSGSGGISPRDVLCARPAVCEAAVGKHSEALEEIIDSKSRKGEYLLIKYCLF